MPAQRRGASTDGTSGDPADVRSAATEVEATLERVLDRIEHAVGAYLQASHDEQRAELIAAIELLDELTARSDAYESSLVNSPIWGFSGKGSVIGETNSHPFVELVSNSVLEAQVELVKAVKAELTQRSLTTLEALRTAAGTLAQAHGQPD